MVVLSQADSSQTKSVSPLKLFFNNLTQVSLSKYLYFLFQSLLCYSTPNTHPYISKKELNYLNANVTSSENTGIKDPVPWRAILTSAPVWALVWAAVSIVFYLFWVVPICSTSSFNKMSQFLS